MPQPYSIIVYFKATALPPDRRQNPFHRRALMEEGIATIRSHIPKVEIGQPRVPSLSVSVTAPNAHIMTELVSFLDDTGLAECILEGKMLRAVRDDGDGKNSAQD